MKLQRTKSGRIGVASHINVRTDAREEGSVYVYAGRPSVFGNPFASKDSNIPGVTKVPTAEIAVSLYKRFMLLEMEREGSELRAALMGIVEQLKAGHNVQLGCWCKPRICHAQIISDFCNERVSQAVDVVV